MNRYHAIFAAVALAIAAQAQPDPRGSVVGPALSAPDTASEFLEQGPSLEQIRQGELARRQELEATAATLIDQAKTALAPPSGSDREPDFERARDLLVKAEYDLHKASQSKSSVLDKLTLVQALLEITYSRWAESLVTQGDRLAQLKKYDEAIQRYQAAMDICPDVKTDVAPRVHKTRSAKERAEFRRKVYSILE